MVSVDDWFNLSEYKERNEYTFVKIDRSLIQSNDLSAEEKGLYVTMMLLAFKTTTQEMKLNVELDTVIKTLSSVTDSRSITKQGEIVVNYLNKMNGENIICDLNITNNVIKATLSADCTPFTKFYSPVREIDLPKLRAKTVVKTLKNIAIYSFIITSSGADKARHAHLYINGLSYMSECLGMSYTTLKDNVDALVNQQILARKTYTTRDRRKHTLLTTYTQLDIQQLDNYVNSVFGKQSKQQQQQEEQRQEKPQYVDDDSDNTPAKSHKSTTSYFDEVSDYVGFDVTDDKTILKIVKGWESHYNMQIVLTALDKLKYKIADFKPSSNLHMINWVNKLLTSGGYLDDVKAGLAEVSRVDELRRQGKVVDAKDIPNERIDFLGDEKDTDNSSIKVKKDLETKQETEDGDKDDVIEDVDFQAIADNIFKYN